MHLKCECVNNYAITYLTWHDTHMVDFIVRIEHLNPALKKVFCKEHKGIFSHVDQTVSVLWRVVGENLDQKL